MEEFDNYPYWLGTNFDDEGGSPIVNALLWVVVLIGGLYLALRGLFGVDIFALALSHTGARVIQAIVGLSAIWGVFRVALSSSSSSSPAPGSDGLVARQHL